MRMKEELSSILCEFLEVAVNCILYTRHLYPSSVFVRQKKYNVPLQICQHPQVNKYISNTISGIKLLLETGEVDQVVLAILGSTNQPLERFVFEIGNTAETYESDELLFQLEESLRALILKINTSDALLAPLPSGCSWAIQLHTKRSTVAAVTGQHQELQEFAWVEAERSEVDMVNSSLVPLKSLTSHTLQMQLFVEESDHKTSPNTVPIP